MFRRGGMLRRWVALPNDHHFTFFVCHFYESLLPVKCGPKLNAAVVPVFYPSSAVAGLSPCGAFEVRRLPILASRSRVCRQSLIPQVALELTSASRVR